MPSYTGTGQIDTTTEGVAAERRPLGYRGVALKVVVGPEGDPVLAFDGNGRVVYQRADHQHFVVDWVPAGAINLIATVNSAVRDV